MMSLDLVELLATLLGNAYVAKNVGVAESTVRAWRSRRAGKPSKVPAPAGARVRALISLARTVAAELTAAAKKAQ